MKPPRTKKLPSKFTRTFDMAQVVETGETVNQTEDVKLAYTGLDSINNSKDTSGMGVTPVI